MAHVVACQTVLIREDWMRKHMEGHESEKVWSYSRISQLAEGTSIFVWNWFFMVDHDIGTTHHVKTYETFESHYVLGVPIISPSTFPGSSALNKAHCNHVQCFHDFLLQHWYKKTTLLRSGVHVPKLWVCWCCATGSTGNLDWCGREGWGRHSLEGAVMVLPRLAWDYLVGFKPWMMFFVFFGGKLQGRYCLFYLAYY